jgi:hypothetical protein
VGLGPHDSFVMLAPVTLVRSRTRAQRFPAFADKDEVPGSSPGGPTNPSPAHGHLGRQLPIDLPITPQHALVGRWSSVIGGSRGKEPSSPPQCLHLRPPGTKGRTCRPSTSSSRPRRSRWILPRSSASSAHLGDRGGVDLQRVRRPDGADPRRRTPGNSWAPLVADMVLSHPTVSSADPALIEQL